MPHHFYSMFSHKGGGHDRSFRFERDTTEPPSRGATALGALCVIIAIAVAGESVHAQSTWHVDASVCPAVGTGTQTDPFCKIQDTLSAAAGEDEVLVRPSEYVETLFNLIKPITLRSTGGAEQTIVTGVLVPLWSLTAW